MKPETRTVNKIMEVLGKRKYTWAFKVHGSPFQRAGVPDILGVCRGRCFAIEVKEPGNVPTLLQTRTLDKLRAAGAIVGVAWSLEQFFEILDYPPAWCEDHGCPESICPCGSGG